MITLAAQAALAANAQVIGCCAWSARATPISPAPSCAASPCGRCSGPRSAPRFAMAAVALLPSADAPGGFLTGLGFRGGLALAAGDAAAGRSGRLLGHAHRRAAH
jgi:cell division transport system permease protein